MTHKDLTLKENKFIDGWWNCFNAFFLEFLSRDSNSRDSHSDHLTNVLKDAGVGIDEIQGAINSNVLTESLKKWLKKLIGETTDEPEDEIKLEKGEWGTTKWEYKKEILHTSITPLIDFLNINGRKGWEYIESERIGSALICIFKRKIEG